MMNTLLQGSAGTLLARRCTANPLASAFLQGQGVQCRVSRKGHGHRKVTSMKVCKSTVCFLLARLTWPALTATPQGMAGTLQNAAYDPLAPAYANALVELASDKKALSEVHSDVDTLRVIPRSLPSLLLVGRSCPARSLSDRPVLPTSRQFTKGSCLAEGTPLAQE